MPRATRSTESHCSFPLQQCLPEAGPNQHCHPSPWHPGGCLGHLPRRPSAPHRCAQATTRTPGPPSTGRSTWRSLPPASPWPCLAALILTVWLRRICPISPSAVSREQRIRWDTDEATNQQGGWIPNSSGYQEAKPGGLGRRNTAEHVLLLKSTWGNSTSWLLTKQYLLGLLPWDSVPEGADEIQRPGWPQHQRAQDGAPWIWHGRGSLWQAHPGRQRPWELSPTLASHSHRATFSVTEAVHACWGYRDLFYKLDQNIYLGSFICASPSNKAMRWPSKKVKFLSKLSFSCLLWLKEVPSISCAFYLKLRSLLCYYLI